MELSSATNLFQAQEKLEGNVVSSQNYTQRKNEPWLTQVDAGTQHRGTATGIKPRDHKITQAAMLLLILAIHLTNSCAHY